MTGEEFRKVKEFESAMEEGDHVRVLWTNSGNFFGAIAKVVKINRKSVRVALSEPVGTDALASFYPRGHHITVPTISDIQRWSENNRVEPIRGYS